MSTHFDDDKTRTPIEGADEAHLTKRRAFLLLLSGAATIGAAGFLAACAGSPTSPTSSSSSGFTWRKRVVLFVFVEFEQRRFVLVLVERLQLEQQFDFVLELRRIQQQLERVELGFVVIVVVGRIE